ncbi:MAG: TolB family protein [Cyanobium sp.]
MRILGQSLLATGLALLATACAADMPRPLVGIDRQLEQAGAGSSPSLAGRWLALIAARGERQEVVLVDLEGQGPVPLGGLNRTDAQPLAVSVDAGGERLAVVRQLEGRTELVLYRRRAQAVERIPMQPAGVPRRVSLRADGRELAVEVSRDGLWQVDLVRLP